MTNIWNKEPYVLAHEKYAQELVDITIMYTYGRNEELLRDILR